MSETFLFFEEAIKSYIEQSVSKYSKSPELIYDKNFDNTLLKPLFINDITMFKNIIQKNKLSYTIWRSFGDLMFEKTADVSNNFSTQLNNDKQKIEQYEARIKKWDKYIKYLERKLSDVTQQIEDNLKNSKKVEKAEENSIEENDLNDNSDNISGVQDKEDDLLGEEDEKNKAKINMKELKEKVEYDKTIKEGKESIENNEKKIKHKKKKRTYGKFNLIKLKLLQLTTYILVNEIYNNEFNNDNNKDNDKDTDKSSNKGVNIYDKDKNYKKLNEYINDLIERGEIIKDKIKYNYITFIKSYIIGLVLIINNQGYKDINKDFLNQILERLKDNQKKYSSKEISDLVIYIGKLINNPDTFLCPNAFSILKNASHKKIRPRSRNNSFDKNDLTTNNNNDAKNKNERNTKIDDFFKSKKEDSDEEEDCMKKKSSVISWKNNNNQNLNNIFLSQGSLGLNDNHSKIKYNSMSSALSNNSLLALDLQYQASNLLNSSKLSCDDSMVENSFCKPSAYSELAPHDSMLGGKAGINSRLASHLPVLRISQDEKKRKNPAFDIFQKKLGKDFFKRKESKEKLEKSLNKELVSIVHDNFYGNNNGDVNNCNNNDKIVMDNKLKDKKINTTNEVLVCKTPVKIVCKSEELKEESKNNENLRINGIKKNLGALFNQHIGQ